MRSLPSCASVLVKPPSRSVSANRACSDQTSPLPLQPILILRIVFHLVSCHTPPSVILELLEHLPRALLDGCKSIRDTSNHKVRSPIWIIQYWHQAQDFLKHQDRWRTCYKWLETHKYAEDCFATFDTATLLLQNLSWNAPLTNPGTTTSLFSKFLSDERLCDESMHLMVQHINYAYRISPGSLPSITAVDREFTLAICSVTNEKTYQHPSRKVLTAYEDQKTNRILYFPFFVPDIKHWIAFCINFSQHRFCYGLHP